MNDNTALLEDIKKYSAFLDQVHNNYEVEPWWKSGWYVVSTNITEHWDPSEGDEIQGIYLRTDEVPSQRDNKTYHKFLILTERGIVGVNEAKIMEDYSQSFQKGQILWFKFLEAQKSASSGNTFRKFFVRAKDLDLSAPTPLNNGFRTAKEVMANEGQVIAEDKPDPAIPDETENTLADQDDPQAENTINIYRDLHKSENYDQEPTDEDLIKILNTDPDMKGKETSKSRIKAQIARMVKRGDIKQAQK